MRPTNKLGIFAVLILIAAPARAQIKDMPSQAELDPILENADSKVGDFIATLTKFRVEASAMDPERLEKDLKDFNNLREMIRVAESGPTNRNGINMQRLLGILTGVDDAALEAARWKNGAELYMCQQLLKRQNTSRYDLFSTGLAINLDMLREVGGQIFHPTFRLAGAADELVLALTESESKSKPKPR